MKTDLSKQTKYFKQVFNKKTLKFDLKEIPLGRNTWWYVQVDSSIRYVFLKHNLQIPKYVIVEDATHYITFKIYRENIKNIKDAARNKGITLNDGQIMDIALKNKDRILSVGELYKAVSVASEKGDDWERD